MGAQVRLVGPAGAAGTPAEGLVRLDRRAVRGITHMGGTILGTTNRGNPLKYPVKAADGSVHNVHA